MKEESEAEVGEHFLELLQTRGRYVEDFAILMLRTMAPDHAYSIPVKTHPFVEDLAKEVVRGTKVENRIWLYLALSIKRPLLLHSLVDVYAACDAKLQDHFEAKIEEAIRHIPSTDDQLLLLVKRGKKETAALVLKVLSILVAAGPLRPEYGPAAVELHTSTGNARFLIRGIAGLSREDILTHLPKMLQLERAELELGFKLLLQAKPGPISATELLHELHLLGETKQHMKTAIEALNVMFGLRELYDVKAYGIVIEQLAELQT